MIVSGSVGVGKTHLIKFLGKWVTEYDIKKEYGTPLFIYVNCSVYDSVTAIAIEIIKGFGKYNINILEKALLDNELGSIPKEGARKGRFYDLIQSCIKYANQSFLVIYDEIDKVESRFKESLSKFLIFLWNLPEELYEENIIANSIKVNGLFVVNNSDKFLDLLTESAKTRLKFDNEFSLDENHVVLNPYNKAQLSTIYANRIKSIHEDKISRDEIIELLTSYTKYKFKNNVRLGISLLYSIVIFSYQNGVKLINKDIFENAFKKFQINKFKEVWKGTEEPHEKLAFLAFFYCYRYESNQSPVAITFVKTIYKNHIAPRFTKDPNARGKRRIIAYLGYFVETGVLDVYGGTGRGKITRYMLSEFIDDNTVTTVLKSDPFLIDNEFTDVLDGNL